MYLGLVLVGLGVIYLGLVQGFFRVGLEVIMGYIVIYWDFIVIQWDLNGIYPAW